MIGVGIDAVEVDRFRNDNTKLIERLLTRTERDYCDQFADPAPSVAARFAAKEATMKALGVGLGAFEFHDVEVTREETGKPVLLVTGRAREIATGLGVTQFLVSLSHTNSLATAIVVAE